MLLVDLFHRYREVSFLDRELLAAATLDKDRAFILANPSLELTKSQVKELSSFLKRREKREPIAYILEEKEFYGRAFRVTRATLIPRPETELLIEEALKTLQSDFCPQKKRATLIDIGTGSGNIITTLALEHACATGHLSFYASDWKRKAVRVARNNARRYGVSKRISFFTGDLLEPFFKKSALRSSSLIIVANLPYISRSLFQKVSEDVRKYEPRHALVSQNKGLDHYIRLLGMIKKNLSHTDALLFFEISPEQRLPLRTKILRMFPRAKIFFFRDLSGRYRLARISLIQAIK